MPHPGPSTFRSLRKLALTKGTTPAGFDGQEYGEAGPPNPTYPVPFHDPGCDHVPEAGTGIRQPDPQPHPFKLGG
jgi:hypothetical protein